MLNQLGIQHQAYRYEGYYHHIVNMLNDKSRGRKGEVLVNSGPGSTWARLDGETLVFRYETKTRDRGDVALDVMRMSPSGAWVFDCYNYFTQLTCDLFKALTGISAYSRQEQLYIGDTTGEYRPFGRYVRNECSSTNNFQLVVAPNVLNWVALVNKRLMMFNLSKHLKPADALREVIKPVKHTTRYTMQVKAYLEGSDKPITAATARTLAEARLAEIIHRWCPKAEE